MKSVKPLLMTAAVTLGLLAAARWAWDHQGWWLARHWASQLERASEDRLDGLLERIAGLGEPGIPALVEALGSARPELAERAAAVIGDEIERWKTLPAETAGPRIAALSRALAAQVEHFGPQARQRAAAIAKRVLAWPRDDAIRGSEVVLCCEAVLRSASSCEGQGEPEVAAGRGSPETSSREGIRTCDTALQWDAPLLGGSPLAGGQIPVETAPFPDTLTDGRTGFQPVPPIASVEPQPLGAPSSDQALRRLPRPGTPSVEQGEDGQRPGWRSPFVRRLTPGDQQRQGEAAAATQALGPETLAAVGRLQAQDPREAAEAEAELKRRGFGDRELALARQLSDPDPQTRRRLVRLLPEIAGLDAVPWFLELSRDADAEVRWTALTLLATTGDPSLLERVGELVRGDPDPRIQRLAERLGQTPKGSGGGTP